MRRLLLAALAAAALLPLTTSTALAHPLGNFTVNHYAGIRVEPDRVLLDVVIDAAEIPTFQATTMLDLDRDGALSGTETAGLPETRCGAIGRGLMLAIDGVPAGLRLSAAGVTFPAGNGGLPTMRSVCQFEVEVKVAADGAATITFRDAFEEARIGWREITAVGDRMTVAAADAGAVAGAEAGAGAGAGAVSAASVSDRLTAYPADLAAAPDRRAVTLTVRAGGPRLAPFTSPGAEPLTSVRAGADPAASAGPGPSATLRSEAAHTAVPGGADAIPAALGQAPVSPILALVAVLTAALLGAGHALTPGHGKTLMAAYLVGTRGSPRHALGLGLAVSVSHTAGILVLAIVILAAESTLPADVVLRAAPVIAAVSILVIGAWMLVTELRRRGSAAAAADPTHDHRHIPESGHDHGHEASHEHAHERAVQNPPAAGGHDHDHAAGAHDQGHDYDHDHDHDAEVHRHGPISHRHLPRSGTTVTWRGLFLLGLAGGLVPSANALLVLLGSIAAGRPAWGVVLVAAFGLGMAAVMAGIGLACVYARGLVDRVPARVPLRTVGRLVPLGAAVIVLSLGVVLTTQALARTGLG
ncbi:MAG TPA: sulfite exporter TauE/SafE family protein [Candidatus Limnocylindrales bacterium]|nr:sulfite exporter TauE/SafE family protein [Candidatus Limnocylindrales bacterium]